MSVASFKAAARKSGILRLVARLDYGPGTSYITLSSGKVGKIDGERYRPLLEGIPTYRAGVDFEKWDVQVADIVVKFSNPDQRLSDLITDTDLGAGSNTGFYNRDCELKLWTKGVTTWADCLPYYKGPTKDILGHKTLRFEIEDFGELFYAAGFTEELTDSDAASGEGGILPEESKGEVKPEIYGEYNSNTQSTDPATIVFSRDPNGSQCKYLGRNTAGAHLYQVSNQKMDSITTDDVWGWDPNLKRRVFINDMTVVQNDANGCIISHPDGVEFLDYFYPDGTNSGVGSSGGGDGSGSVSDEENMGDKNNATFGRLAVTDSSIPSAPSAQASVDFAAYKNNGTISSVGVRGRANYTGTPANSTATINGVDAESSDGSVYELFGTVAASEAGAGAPVASVLLGGQNIGSPQSHTLDVYMIFKTVLYEPSDRLDIYQAGDGAEVSTAFNGRSTAEGFTVTHPDDDNAGLIALNPITLMELAHRDLYGLTTAQINEDSFNISAAQVAAWKFASDMAANESGLIEKLGKDSMSFMVYPGDGLATSIMVKDEYTASAITVDIKDVLTTGDLFTRSKTKNIISTAIVEYGIDPISKNTRFTEEFTNSTVLTQYGLTAKQGTKRFPTLFINDSVTALLLATKLQKFWQNHHNIFTGLLPLKYIDIEVGTIIEFKNVGELIYGEDVTDNATTRMGQQIYKYFIVREIVKTDQNIKIEAWQMHDLS